MVDYQVEYVHSKTGNVYNFLSMVYPTDVIPPNYTMLFTAKCSETKAAVKVYLQDDVHYFVSQDHPNLHEADKVKVLYERDSVMWLRTKDDFHKLVELNGELVPRFVKVEED